MKPNRNRAFTLVEVMIAGTICVVTVGLTLGVFTTALRMMYKDAQRLTTNTLLRNATAQISNEARDASEFYIFPSYQSIDSTVTVSTDVSAADATNTTDYYGDCLVLVVRVSDAGGSSSNIKQIKIFYRTSTSPSQDGELRLFKGNDYGDTGSAASLDSLLSSINLNAQPRPTSSKLLAPIAHGRLRPTSGNYPIFSSDGNVCTPTNQSISINMEIVNGTSANNLLSSSSFNYTISPRR